MGRMRQAQSSMKTVVEAKIVLDMVGMIMKRERERERERERWGGRTRGEQRASRWGRIL
jgi:hypothetical protein